MNKMPTQLLKYLVQECTKEVLDQLIAEEKIRVSYRKDNEKATEVPIKHKIPVKTKVAKNSKFYVKPKVQMEAEEPAPTPEPEGPEAGGGEEPEAPMPKPSEPKAETPAPASKGPVVINPRDKSKLEPIRFQGKDEASIERTLHSIATKVAGPRTKVSLGAKRLARQAASSPGSAVFFYFGKIDPESEEVFLMADKSLQIAKDESVQPGELQGVPAAQPQTPPNAPETDPDFYIPGRHDLATKSDTEYDAYQASKIRGTPRYGIDESTQKLIKKAINKILDRR